MSNRSYRDYFPLDPPEEPPAEKDHYYNLIQEVATFIVLSNLLHVVALLGVFPNGVVQLTLLAASIAMCFTLHRIQAKSGRSTE